MWFLENRGREESLLVVTAQAPCDSGSQGPERTGGSPGCVSHEVQGDLGRGCKSQAWCLGSLDARETFP